MLNKLNNKQHINEKLLNINGNQSKVNDINVIDNAYVSKNYSAFEYNKDQNKSGKPNVDFNKRNSPRKKVTVIGDSMIKYLRCENFTN